MQLDWEWQNGENVSAKRLDELHCLRNRIFIVMTQDPWPEVDGNDTQSNCYHLCGLATDTKSIVAYGRLIIPTNANEAVRFSRVFVVPDFRGRGYFRQIIERILEKAISLGFSESAMHIHATLSFETNKVYGDFGFEAIGKVDKIPSGICLQDKRLAHIGKAYAQYQELRTVRQYRHQQSLFASQVTQHTQSDSLNTCQALK